jgi:hypothetical protein
MATLVGCAPITILAMDVGKFAAVARIAEGVEVYTTFFT